MKSNVNIFQQTYEHYLEQIRNIRLDSVAPRIGAVIEENRIRIKLLNSEYHVSAKEIYGPSGQKPPLDICVILSKYILLCPENPPHEHDWVSYRNFKNSAPLVDFFNNEVTEAISSFFSGKIKTLQKAGESLAGYKPDLQVNYDLIMQFDALPRIPVVLLFNDADEEFPAACSILFQTQAEKYLDCESLAMIGTQLFSRLKQAIQ